MKIERKEVLCVERVEGPNLNVSPLSMAWSVLTLRTASTTFRKRRYLRLSSHEQQTGLLSNTVTDLDKDNDK